MKRALAVLRRILILFLWMLVGLVIGVFATLLVDAVYELLFKLMPSVFPLYNSVLEEAAYERMRARLDLISFALTLAVTVYLSLRFDNAREEATITRTDGLFSLREELPVYFKGYVAEDIISSLTVAFAITLPFAFIPTRFLEMTNFASSLLNLFYRIISLFGLCAFGIITALSLFASHMIGAALSLKHWRAKWLSGFGEVR